MPDLVRKSVFEIDLEELRRQGIRGLILDLDNTVIHWNRDVLESKMCDWFYQSMFISSKYVFYLIIFPRVYRE